MIRLSSEQLAAIASDAEDKYPLECCGVILGDVVDGEKVPVEVRPLENTFQPSEAFEMTVDGSDVRVPPGQERRFMIEPQTMFKLMQEERKSKVKVLGFYHSHPDHPAKPSEYDRTWAMPWYSYIITSVQNGTPAETTSWTLSQDGAQFEQEEIVT